MPLSNTYTNPIIFNTVPKHNYPEILGKNNKSPETVMEFLHLSRKEALRLTTKSIKKSSILPNKLPEEVKIRLIEIGTACELVADFFDGDIEKTALWLRIPNPALGNISPLDMIKIGRYKVLIDFIKNSLNGNFA